MAILIYGSPCPLCGKPRLEGQKIVTFSPFVPNEADPLWKFSDGAFHEECFRRDPLADAARRRYQEVKRRALFRCHICGKAITNPDDYIPFGHLTDDPSHPLYPLNFTEFHRSCLADWSQLRPVYELALTEVRSGAWKGRGMQWLLDTLKAAHTK